MLKDILKNSSWEMMVTLVIFLAVFPLVMRMRYLKKLWPISILRGIHFEIDKYRYLFRGADMIDEAYVESSGSSFVINTPGKKNIMVTSRLHIQEIVTSPVNILSLHAVAKDFLQPKHTMNGFEWKNQRGIEGVGFVRALRTLLTSRLPILLPKLERAIENQLSQEMQKHRVKDGYYQMPILSMSEKLVTRCNSLVFFGPELSDNLDFVEAALNFPKDVFLAAELLRILPSLIAPFIASLVTIKHRSSRTMYNLLLPVVRKRMAQRDIIPKGEEASDGIQWLIETSPKRNTWTAERLVGEIMAIWYGSVHTLSIATSYAIHDLYSHPEYLSTLREELLSPAYDEFTKTAEGLPLLDSFLKESARLSAFESTGVRRETLQDFTFSDGLHVSKGDWICIPHRSMMRDSSNFPSALEFNAFRFLPGAEVNSSTNSNLNNHDTEDSPASTLNKPSLPQNTKQNRSANLTASSDTWLVWGAGRILCPGRFYATLMLKLVIIEFMTKWDCKLEYPSGYQRSIQWRSSIIPKMGLKLLMKRGDENTRA